MANNTSTFTLKLKTEGMDQAQAGSKQIRENLEGAQKAVSTMKVAQSAAAQPTGRAGASAGIVAGQEVETYNRARGAAGAAGGTARDFADQARGLGGLVRLYATFAANVFALTAAFGALSRAMDTTNMVKGLDQLGAASGTALGSLSKRLVEATDGAISLREAMEATVKASSSGISTDNILRLGKVAQQASLALGVDATDAVSRLTRGITKLEPELLDELGIFTKIDPAVETYAKRIGKATTELTDFERRLAFTTAVLEEGEKKFSAIEIETNPYNQLVASLKNVLQTGLEVVNTVLGPIVRYLAESPVALGAAIAAFATVLLKQAIPAIGQFRAGLQQTADEAQDLAVRKGQEALAARKTVDAAILSQLEATADQRVAALDAAEEKVQNINAKSISKQSLAYKLLQSDIVDVTEEQIKAVEARAKIADKEGRTDQARTYREIATAVREHKVAEEELLVAKQKMAVQYEKDAKGITAFGATVRAAEAAQKKAAMSGIVSNAAYNASLIGMSGATTLARAEVEKLGISLTKTELLLLKTRIAAATLGGTLATLSVFMNNIFAAIAVATVAFTIFDSLLSKNSKQLSEFNGSVDRTNKSVSTLEDTFTALGKKSPDQYFNTESLTAVATAVMEISDATAELIKNSEKLEKASSGWDNFIDSIKSMWGGDRQSKFADSLTESTLGALNELGDSPEALAAKKKIAGLLKIDPNATTKEWEKAYKGVYGNKTALREIETIMKGVAVSFGIAASRAQEFDEALKKTKETYQSFLDKFKIKDELSLVGLQFIDLGVQMAKSFESPEEAIRNLAKIVGDQKALSLFGPDDQRDLLAYSKDIDNLNKKFQQQKLDLQNLQTERNKLESSDVEIRTVDELTGDVSVTTKNAAEIASLTSRIAQKTSEVTDSNKQIAAILEKFPNLAASRLTEGAKQIDASISLAFAKATGALQNAVLGVTGDLPGAAQKRYDLAIKQLDSENTLIRVQLGLIRSNKEIVAANKVKMAQDERLAAETALGKKAEITGMTPEALLAVPDSQKEPEALRLTKALTAEKQAEEYETAVKTIGNSTRGAMQLVSGMATKGNELIKTNFKDLADYALQVSGLQAQLVSNLDKKAAEAFNKRIAELKEETLVQQKQLDANKATIDLDRQRITNLAQAGQVSETQLLIEEQKLFVRQRENEEAGKLLQLTNTIKGLEEAKKADPGRATQIQAEIDRLNDEKKRETQSKILAIETNRLATIDKILQKDLQIIDKQEKSRQTAEEIARIREDGALALRELELQTALDTEKYTVEYANGLKFELDIFKITEAAKRRESDLTSTYRVEKAKLTAQLMAEAEKSGLSDEGTPRSRELAGQLVDLDQRFLAEVGGIKAVTEAEIAKARAIRDSKKEQDGFNQSLAVLKDFESVFTSMGSALSNFVSSLGDAVKAQDQYNASRAKLVADEAKETDDKKKLQFREQIANLDKQRAKDELTANAKLIGSAKNLFKEKTAAYKAFATVEKALHIARIAMEFKELATSLFVEKGKVAGAVAGEAGQTAATGAGFFARAGLYVTEIFSKISAQLGIFGPPVAAAIVAAIGLSAFGKKSVQPGGFTAEEQQKVQGTGQTYRDGKLVTREGGVLGDPTAKASSVSKSLEFVGKNTFQNLEFSNRMVDALKAIEKNTRGLTAAMLRSIGPQAQGSLVGSIQTGETRGNYLGGNTLVNAGLGAAGGFAAGVGMLSTGLGTAAMAGASALLGITAGNLLNFVLPGIGLLLAKPLGKLMGSIFGGKTTKTIEDFGITVNGVLNDVIAGTEGVIEEWANVKTVRKGGWFRRDKTTFDTVTQEATDPIKALVGNLFMGVRDSLISAGEVLGKDVSSTIGNFLIKDFKISSKDLKPEELAAAIQGEVSIAFNQMAMAAFPEFEKFAQPFEEAGETIIRLARQVQVFDMAMMTISKATEGMSSMMKVEVSNSLIELAGGLEQFVEKTNFYAENFLTEAERLAPVQKAVTTELDRLGLGFVDTREEFKAVVDAIDLTVPAGRELYNSMMNLAPGFAQVYKESQKALSAEEMRSKVLNQQIEILKLLGKDEEVLALQRAEELAELAKYPKAQADVLIANQKYIHALEDERSLKDKLIKQRDKERTALNSTINSLKNSITTLDNYRLALVGGDKSILTPLEKYQQSQTEFLRLQAAAQAPATTEAERAAQAEAINKLPAAADRFLESSRTLFASSDRYTADFNSVMSTVEGTSASLTAQKSTAELQLDQLESSTSFLDAIQANTFTTAELLQQYFAQQQTTQTLAQSATLPTPQQPQEVKEVTDKAVVAEIVKSNIALEQLRLEIEKLRTEQQAQTGAIISSNAQVVNNNAQTVAGAVHESADNQSWLGRQVVDLP